MADKAISELIAASQITATDMFVLEQGGTAKKLTGQVLLNWLTAAADGHGGIQSIAKVSTSGLADTYRITLADTTAFDFVVTNGRGISSISKKSTSGLEDTYTITYNDGASGSFTVTNGAQGDKGDAAYIWVKYASEEPTSSSISLGDIPDDWMGIYVGTSATAPTSYSSYKWYKIRGEQGETGDPATLVSSSVTYQVGESGMVIPSGIWSTSIPVVAQGKYLWTKIVQTFNTGSPVTFYTVGRMGLDGLGSVVSVAGISPNEDGNVPLTASDIDALPNSGGDLTGELRMNGQPISGLNEPTADDQAANLGYVKKASPTNLLDNSNFSNPVNQRELTSYTGNGYSIDRWIVTNDATTVSIGDGYVTVVKATDSTSTGSSHILRQYIAVDAGKSGKTVTFAAKVKGGPVRLNFNGTDYGTYKTSDDWAVHCITATIPTDTETFSVALQGKNGFSYSCEWIALYEGEYTTETVPEYQPKGYGSELAECMRYYQIAANAFGHIRSNGNNAYAMFSLGTPMRTTDISVAKYSITAIRCGALIDPAETPITGVTVAEYLANSLTVKLNISGSFGSEYAQCVAYIDGLFHLSADFPL